MEMLTWPGLRAVEGFESFRALIWNNRIKGGGGLGLLGVIP